jgi:hypothetical protein
MEMRDKKQTMVLAEAPHQTPKANPYRYVNNEVPRRAVL